VTARRGGGETPRLRKQLELWDRCVAIGDEAGAGGFVALDLVMAYQNPRGVAKLVRNEAKVAD